MASVDVDEVDFKGHIFRASDCLSDSNTQSNVLHSSYEDFLKKKRVIPESALVYIPSDPKVCVDWTCPGWFSIFEIAFRTGFSFPCSNLMCNVIKTLGVMPFQLMPAVWKLISAIDSLCAKHHLEITLQDLMNCYLVRTVGKGRVSFRALKVEEALITGLDSGDDKGWACRFLFINKASLDEGYEYIPDYPADKPNEWEAVIDNASIARLTAFRNLDAEERTWPRALCRSLAPQYDLGKSEAKSVALSLEDVQMKDPESDNNDGGSIDVAVKKAISFATPVGSRTRGKGKLSCVIEEIQASKKRVKIEKDIPKVNPAPFKLVDLVLGSPKLASVPVSTPVSHSLRTKGLKKTLKALSLNEVGYNFCEISPVRGEEISESMSELVKPGVFDMEFDSLVKRSVFASFQALHFSSAVARARQVAELKENGLIKKLSDLEVAYRAMEEELKLERSGSTSMLSELEGVEAELKTAKNTLKSSDEKLLKVMSDHEVKLKEAAVQYTLIARIGMMMESEESKAGWNVKEEIEVFKLKFPDSNLEEWGLSEVEDDSSVSK